MSSNRYEREEYYQADRHSFPISPARIPLDTKDLPNGSRLDVPSLYSSNGSTASNSSASDNGSVRALATSMHSTLTVESDSSAGNQPPSEVSADTSVSSAGLNNQDAALLRKWTPTRDHPSDPDAAWVALATEVDRLDQTVEQTKRELRRLKQSGNKRRTQRKHQLEAMETRQMTFTEILRRMDNELNDRDVYEYGDILAVTFGNRKIYAHRAIGLEALLCQFMHQMLAKQHQLKIMKRAGRDLQSLFKHSRNQVREEYHSYQALSVKIQASRLTLENFYEDLFSSQHSLLSRLITISQHPEDYNRQQLLRNALVATPTTKPMGSSGPNAGRFSMRASRQGNGAFRGGVSDAQSSFRSRQSVLPTGNNRQIIERQKNHDESNKDDSNHESSSTLHKSMDTSTDADDAVLALLRSPSHDESGEGSTTSSLSSSRAASNTLASKANEIYAASRMKRKTESTNKSSSSLSSLTSASSNRNAPPPIATIIPKSTSQDDGSPTSTSSSNTTQSLSQMTRDRLRQLEQQRVAAGKAPMTKRMSTASLPSTTSKQGRAPWRTSVSSASPSQNARNRLRTLEEARNPTSMKNFAQGFTKLMREKSPLPSSAPVSQPSSPGTRASASTVPVTNISDYAVVGRQKVALMQRTVSVESSSSSSSSLGPRPGFEV